MIKKLFIIVIVLGGFSSISLGQNALLESLKVPNQKKWRAGLSTSHRDGFGDTRVEPSTIFGLGLNGSLTKNLNVVAFLRGSKVYNIDFDTENEFKLADPYIGMRHSFKRKLLKATPMLSYGLYLPLSEFSRRNDIQTKLYLGASTSWFVFNNLVSITTGLSGLYFINKYSTTKTRAGSSGGSLMPLFDSSASLSVSTSLGEYFKFKRRIFKTLLFTLNGSYTITNYENFTIEPVESSSFRDVDYSYGLSASATVSPLKNWYASLGYGYGANIENLGRTEYYLFDSQSSRWSLGLRYVAKF